MATIFNRIIASLFLLAVSHYATAMIPAALALCNKKLEKVTLKYERLATVTLHNPLEDGAIIKIVNYSEMEGHEKQIVGAMGRFYEKLVERGSADFDMLLNGILYQDDFEEKENVEKGEKFITVICGEAQKKIKLSQQDNCKSFEVLYKPSYFNKDLSLNAKGVMPLFNFVEALVSPVASTMAQVMLGDLEHCIARKTREKY